jgi:chemotaxis protein CheX
MSVLVPSPVLQSVFLPPFIASTKAVFKTMLGWDVDVEAAGKYNTFQPAHDVSGIISFAGGLKGTIVVCLDKEVAFAAADAFIGERPSTINSDVLDLVGELANMIGGGAKDRFNLPDVVLGLPTTIAGSDYHISFTPGTEVETVSFRSSSGLMTVQIAIRQ